MAFLDQIAQFDGQAKPDERQTFEQRDGVDTLPALKGDYELEIIDAEGKESLQQKLPMLVVGLRVVSPAVHAGKVVEFTWFLDTVEKINRCWADLVQLKAPARGQFSAILADMIPRLPGVRFRARRQDKPGTTPGQMFHNFYIGRCVSGACVAAPAAAVFDPEPETVEGDIAW